MLLPDTYHWTVFGGMCVQANIQACTTLVWIMRGLALRPFSRVYIGLKEAPTDPSR
jgi:hypothetical protein